MLAVGVNLLEVLGVCMLLVLAVILTIVGFVVYQVWKFKRAMRTIAANLQTMNPAGTARPGAFGVQIGSMCDLLNRPQGDGYRPPGERPGPSDPSIFVDVEGVVRPADDQPADPQNDPSRESRDTPSDRP